MKLKEYIGVFALSKMQEKDSKNRESALTMFLIFGIFISLFYAVYNLIQCHINGVFASIGFFILLVIAVWFSKKHHAFNTLAYASTILVFIILVSFFITGGFSGYDVLWSYLFPAFTLFLLGLYIGSIFSITLVLSLIVLSFFSTFPLYNGNYTIEFKIQFFASYFSVWGISFIYEYVRTKTRQNLIKAMHDAQKSKHSSIAKTEFILELSRQIRTPLSSIFGIVNIIKEKNLNSQQEELIDGIYTSANNLLTVVDNIANVGEIKVDSNSKNVLTFNLDVILRKCFDEFKLKFDKSDLRYSLNISEYVPDRLVGNPNRIGKIVKALLTNIFTNSKKRTTHIDLFVSDKKETENAIELMFELHCNSLKKASKITEAEYDYSGNQDKASLHVKHMGINENDVNTKFDLSAAKKIVESFGGSIGIKKKDESVTVFWFTLLLWKVGSDSSAKLSEIQDSNDIKKEHKTLSQARILIVEDNLMNQKVISLALKDKVNSFEVANNGKEAVEMFGNSKFDLILMDIMMPVMDGYKATQKIRELEVGSGVYTPIIALTANAVTGDKEKCFELGMDGYITKPFQIENLLDEMERCLVL